MIELILFRLLPQETFKYNSFLMIRSFHYKVFNSTKISTEINFPFPKRQQIKEKSKIEGVSKIFFNYEISLTNVRWFNN